MSRPAEIAELANLVGCRVQLTLSQNSTVAGPSPPPSVVEGIVFTVVPSRNVLALMHNPGPRTTIRMICTTFIQDIRVLDRTDALPQGLCRGAQLSAVQENDSISKAMMKRIRDAETKRNYPANCEAFPVEAGDIFDHLSRLYNVSWNGDRLCIIVESKVAISGGQGNNWREPIVVATGETTDSEFVERVKKQVLAAVSS